jgi:hypothetical protein
MAAEVSVLEPEGDDAAAPGLKRIATKNESSF